MSSVSLSPESTVTIRFADCDPFNHLNNARYIDYFLNAREDHLWGHYQFDIYEHSRETGKSWVVSKNQILYLRPASLREEVIIQSRLLDYNENDLLVEMIMWDENKSQIKALLWSSFSYFNLKTQRRAKHDADLADFFEEVQADINYPNSLEKRLAQLKETAKAVA